MSYQSKEIEFELFLRDRRRVKTVTNNLMALVLLQTIFGLEYLHSADW